jgi:heat-inducible transcriptional repressor
MARLSSRKEQILKSLIEDYIDSAAPVSSAVIQQRHLPDLSSATIRNELAALEEMGYLHQPHTSAGRVPTSAAYELYVDRLMPRRKLSREEIRTIKQHFNRKMLSLKEVLTATAKVISEVTHYTSLACVNDVTDAVIKNVRIVKITPTSALVIVVTDMGILKDAIVTLDEEYTDEYFNAVSELAMQAFGNHSIREVMRPGRLIKSTIKDYTKFFDAILDILKKYNSRIDADDVVLEGTSKILEYPEYANVTKAKALLNTLDARQELVEVLDTDSSMRLNVSIGSDKSEAFGDCAIVTVNYVVDGKSVGKAGVIGPLRMDYSKVVSVLDYVSKVLPQGALNEPTEGQKED